MFKQSKHRLALYKKLYPSIKPYKKKYAMLYGFKLYFLVLSLLAPLLYMILINDVMIGKKVDMLLVVVLGYVGIYLLETLGITLNKALSNKVFIKLNLTLKSKVLKNYTKLNIEAYNGYDSGDLKMRIEDDLTMIEKFFLSHTLEYLYAGISAVIILGILIYMNWILALLGMLMVPFSFLFTKIMGKKANMATEAYRECYGRYETFLHSSLQNWKEVKSNNLEVQKAEIFDGYWKVLSNRFLKNQIYWYTNRAFIAFKDFFITKMNLYFVGGLLIINGHMSVAVLLVFMNYYEQFYSNIMKMTELILGLKTDEPSLDRVIEIISYDHPTKTRVSIKSHDMQIENLSFKYKTSNQWVLKDVNLVIGEKEHISIVGRSGCGKTTLSKILLGLYQPEKGSVLIGGENIHQLEESYVSRTISTVPQDPVLFNLTIRENLQIANNKASDQEIVEACKRASIYEFIIGTPKQFETIIGEKGLKLSGGQKQRLAIARTILVNPSVIIFDESTSSLDHESEKEVLKAIKAISKDKTIITIAHRLTSILAADRVLVMDAGRIVASGKAEELMENNAIFNDLFKRQVKVG